MQILLGASGRRLGIGTTLILSASQNNVNLWNEFGTPAAADLYTVRILPGVIVGSTSVAQPAMTTTPNFTAGSTFLILMEGDGRVQGKGGDGGDGRWVTGLPTAAAGGGGGAGTLPGLAGLQRSTHFPPTDGTDLAGGAGGFASTYTGGAEIDPNTVGEDGGDAIHTWYDIEIEATFGADGAVWGGGGGGRGSFNDNARGGGDPGWWADDHPSIPWADRGRAVILNGGAILTQTNNPDLRFF